MLLSSIRSSLNTLNTFVSYKFCKDSDPDFQKQFKTKVTSDNIKDMIDNVVKSNPVLLFMKGTPKAPQCG